MAIVEDNADLRFYLRENLRLKYNIVEAENGRIGWELIEGQKPDIIVSDVMMPETDGIELCKLVKSNNLSSILNHLVYSKINKIYLLNYL